MTGKIVGALIGLLLLRNGWGLLIGLIIGHFYDQATAARSRPRGRNPLEIGQKFFTATFEVMGHVAARQVMSELRLDGPQIHAAIAHFTRGKNADFDLDGTMQEFAELCAHRPDIQRVFLEIQVRAALEGVDMQGPARTVILKVADLLDVSRIEVAHMEAVLRIRREQFRANGGNGGPGGGSAGARAAPRGMQLTAAYQILEVDSKASDEEVAKAYRRQLSKHHPDKLKANGLPDSMLEHAKQRTQQIIEAYELIKSSRQR
jgi:DnaJ like chaperone protein